jgi:hypothetical protein
MLVKCTTNKIVIWIVYFQDIDECKSGSSGCDHKCLNTPGTYHCECNDGFYLDTNNRTCIGRFCITPKCTIFSARNIWTNTNESKE